jgi:hypothetical protein
LFEVAQRPRFFKTVATSVSESVLPSTSDIIAIIGVVVAVAAWLWPRSPPEKHKIEGQAIEESAVPRDQDLEPSEIDIPFPSGLYLLEYEPGVRFSIRENKKSTWSILDIIPRLALSVFVGAVVFDESKMLALFLFCLMLLPLLSRSRLGQVVSVNLQKCTYYVFRSGSGGWGGGWPPDLQLSVNLDPKTNEWVTSLYLATVRIWTTTTPSAEAGRKKIKPFVEALQKIRALRRSKKVGVFDVLAEFWLS